MLSNLFRIFIFLLIALRVAALEAKEFNDSEKLALAIPLSGLLYSGYIRDYEGMEQLAYDFFSVLLVTELVKHTADKPRPGDRDGYSFPSGHTSTAFSGASYWQMRYGWKIGIPMYGVAGLVGYSRVNVHAHRWIEVIAGAALGILGGYIFTTPYEQAKNKSYQLSFRPVLNLDQKKYLGLECQVFF